MAPVIVWFRQDPRLADNPALHAAAESGRPIVPLFDPALAREAALARYARIRR